MLESLWRKLFASSKMNNTPGSLVVSKHYKGIIRNYLTWNPHAHYCGIFPPTMGETEDGLDLEGEGWSGSTRCWFIKPWQTLFFLHRLWTLNPSCLKDAEVQAELQLTSTGQWRGSYNLCELVHSNSQNCPEPLHSPVELLLFIQRL